jgi:hypothetical protein
VEDSSVLLGDLLRVAHDCPEVLVDCLNQSGVGRQRLLVVKDLMPRSAVRFVPVTDLSPCAATLTWAAGRPTAPALQSLLQMLRTHPQTGTTPDTNRPWWDAA